MKSSPRPRAPPAAVAVTASTAAAMDVVPPRNEAQAATSTPLETPELAQNASEMLGARPDRRAARLRSSSARWGAAGFRGPSLVGSLRRRLPRSEPRGCFAPQASAVQASWVRSGGAAAAGQRRCGQRCGRRAAASRYDEASLLCVLRGGAPRWLEKVSSDGATACTAPAIGNWRG